MTKAYRWLAPVGVVAVVGGGVALTSAAASSTPDLPEISTEELLELAMTADVDELTGTIQTQAELGLPELPEGFAAQFEAQMGEETEDAEGGDGEDGDGAAGDEPTGEDGMSGLGAGLLAGDGSDPVSVFLRLASGESTIGIAQDGEERQRLTLVDDQAGLDLVRNGDTLWAYSAADDTAVRATLDGLDEGSVEHGDGPPPWGDHGGPEGADREGVPGDLADATPGELAERLVAEADPTTELSVGTPQEVAGRDAYTLEVTPRSDRTLVEGISIAVDAETGLVLSVTVDSTEQEEPAFQTGFVDLDLSAPDESTFEFTPEESTTVIEADEAGDWPWAHGEELRGEAGPRNGEGPEGDRERSWHHGGDGERPHGMPGREGSPDGAGLDGLAEGFEGGDVTVVGEGWEAVVVIEPPEGADGAGLGAADLGTGGDAPDGTGAESEDAGSSDAGTGTDPGAAPGELAGSLLTQVDGGQAVTTSLLTILFTDDGRVLAGPVPVEVLAEVAG